MFLIHFPKVITMFHRAHLKPMTFGVTLSYLSLEQEVAFPMRAMDLALRGKRMCSKPRGACSFQTWLAFASPPISWKLWPSFAHCPEPDSVSSLILCSKFNIALECNISLPELFLTAPKFIAWTTVMLF